MVEEDRITFSGLLAPGASAHFVVFVHTAEIGDHLVTVRQSAIQPSARAPLLSHGSLLGLAALLGVLASWRLRRAPARYGCGSSGSETR